MKIMLRILLLLLITGVHSGMAQSARTIKLPELQRLISEKSDGIHVINFWATWCAPCVKELPLFEKVNEERSDIKVTLVSLDLDLDPNPDKVYKFIARKDLKSEVLLLDERDPNSWIDKIDARWTGALPATLIVNHATGATIFIGQSLHEGELEQHIAELQ